MLTLIEKIVFLLFVILSVWLSVKTFGRMFEIIGKGQSKISWKDTFANLPKGVKVLVGQRTLFKSRGVIGFIHSLVAWGFTIYILVNLFDVINGYVEITFFHDTWIGFIYRLFVDVFSVLVFLGVAYFLIRRFIFGDEKLAINEPVHLLPEVKAGVRKDSLIVGLFILFHVGGRFLEAAFAIAQTQPDAAQPFATMFSSVWGNLSAEQLVIGEHIAWWFALGLILAFIPYFPLSKHAHLFMGPLNYMLPDNRKYKGSLEPINFEDDSLEQFGAANFNHLSQKSLLDGYACIMCNRCQDNCPAYQTGKELSPSAIEVNKRYFLNHNGGKLIAGEEIPVKDVLLSDNALWACTSCNYCVVTCPVGNEPLIDVLSIRQDKVMMESDFPPELAAMFKSLETNANPWGYNQQDRAEWADGLGIKTMAEDSGGGLLFWVGCAGSYDNRYQKVSRAFARIMQKAGVDFRILGTEEKCNGDTARRLGNEYLAQSMIAENVETLNKYGVKKIVTACPHCFNSLKNDFPDFGGNFEVMHHSELISQLIDEKKLNFISESEKKRVTFHDSCYLGRYNNIYNEPRKAITRISGLELAEMPRNKEQGFCCGAGGGRMFLEETAGTRINENRTNEALSLNIDEIATACPFCMTMITDGVKSAEKEEDVQVKDIAEIILEKLT